MKLFKENVKIEREGTIEHDCNQPKKVQFQ